MTSRNTLPLAKIRMCNVQRSLGQNSDIVRHSMQKLKPSLSAGLDGILNLFLKNRAASKSKMADGRY